MLAIKIWYHIQPRQTAKNWVRFVFMWMPHMHRCVWWSTILKVRHPRFYDFIFNLNLSWDRGSYGGELCLWILCLMRTSGLDAVYSCYASWIHMLLWCQSALFVPMKTTVRRVAGHWSGFQGCLGGNAMYNVLMECRLWWEEPEWAMHSMEYVIVSTGGVWLTWLCN